MVLSTEITEGFQAAAAEVKKKGPHGLPTHAGTRAKRYEPDLCAYNWRSANTRRLHAGLGRAGAALSTAGGLCRIGILGDSKSDQYNGSNAANGGYDITYTKWGHVLKRRLLSMMPSGGTGVVKAFHAGVYDPRWTFTGTWTNDIAGPYVYSLLVGNKATFSTVDSGESGTIVEVWINDYSAAQTTIAVDGAVSGAGFTVVTNTNTNTIKKITLSGLPDTPHTVVISNDNAYTFIYAACVRRAAGIIIDNYAINGGYAALYGSGAGTALGQYARFTNPDPDFLIVPLGINDLNAQGKSVAQTITDLTAALALYPNTDKLLVLEDHTTALSQATWDSWANALYNLADTLDLPLLDLYDRYGLATNTTHAALLTDGVHQSAAGDEDWATAIAALFPALGGVRTAERSITTTKTNGTGTAEIVVASGLVPADMLTASSLLDFRYAGQVSSTATLIFKVRCGPLGTTADPLVATFATSAAGAANAHVDADILVGMTAAGTSGAMTASGRVRLVNAVLGPVTAAYAAATVNTTVKNYVTLTVTQSLSQTLTSRLAALTMLAA